MAKAYSLASWNVEHFRNPDSRVDRVVDFLVDLGPPDVFALYEVEGKEVFDALVSKMPGYTFHITEGPQVQEIMVGVRSTLTAFFTQKTEFKSGLWALRPGLCSRSRSPASRTRSCSSTRRAGWSRSGSGSGTTC